ncbi:MAG: hypothetical protein ACOYMG_24785, partial [Candidatus Methylumidiphilus sp.]
MSQRLWVIDDAVAIVDEGRVTLQISQPTRHLPRKLAFNVADKVWFRNQMRQLETASQKGETKEIPLTSRRRRSSIRMGGGFLLTQGRKLIVPQRNLDAPRPGQLCVCGGVYEYMSVKLGDFDDKADVQVSVKALYEYLSVKFGDFDSVANDYVASLFKESQEIALKRDDILYIPQLAPYSTNEIGFQPPGTLDAYNSIMEAELKNELVKVIPNPPKNERKFWIKVLDYDHAVRLEFAYSPALSVEITAEIDSSSLECFGVLSYPEHIDEAAKAYLEEELDYLNKQNDEETQIEKRENRKKTIKQQEELLKKVEKDIAAKKEIEYWDCELGWDEKTESEPPLHRDIHLIDTETQDVTVWYSDPTRVSRISRSSTLGIELSK